MIDGILLDIPTLASPLEGPQFMRPNLISGSQPRLELPKAFINEEFIDLKFPVAYKLKREGTPYATIKQTIGAQTHLTIFHGKNGYSMIAQYKGLNYIMFPGSTLKTPDTEIELLGDHYKPSVDKDMIPETSEVQTITDQAIILGAGLGERLAPISGEWTGFSKPGVPLLGKKSIIQVGAEHLTTHGIRNLITQTYMAPEKVIEQLRQVENLKVKIIPEVQTPPGTASSVVKAFLDGSIDPTKPLLVMAGDAITNYDMSHLIRQSQKHNAAITIAAKKVPDKEVSQFGIVVSDQSGEYGQSGEIQTFKEKPSLKEAGNARLANTGIYVIAPEMFPFIKELAQEYYADYDEQFKKYEKELKQGKDVKRPELNFDFAKTVFPALMAALDRGEIKNAKTGEKMNFWVEEMKGGFWDDIGNPEVYFRSVLAAVKGYFGFKLPEMINKFVRDGSIFWNGTQDLTDNNGVSVSGNVVVNHHEEQKRRRLLVKTA